MVKISRDFTGELEAGDIDSAAKSAGATPATGTAGMFMVARRAIKVLPGFNVRAETSDYKAHIEDLKLSLIAEGWYKHKPLAAYVVREGAKDIIYVVEGHSRLAAYDEAAAAGKRLGPVPVVFEGKARSVEDLTAQLANANKSRPYGPLELSVIVHRLTDYGWTTERIAQKIGKTDRYVRDLLVLVDAPAAVRSMVAKGQVSATEAIRTIRAEGAEAAEILKEAVANAEASGRKRATAKDTGQRRSPPPPRAARPARPEVTSDTAEVATDADFLSAALHYSLDVADDTRAWLRAWIDGDADICAELENYMGQPVGSTANPDLRVPKPGAEPAADAEEAAADAAFETLEGEAGSLKLVEEVPATATEARRAPSKRPTAKARKAAEAKPAKAGKAKPAKAPRPARPSRKAAAPAEAEAAPAAEPEPLLPPAADSDAALLDENGGL